LLERRPTTIFCDIDGTLVKHNAPVVTAKTNFKLEILPGTLEKLLDWDKKGYNIILISGRRESMRRETEKQLSKLGIIYDQLVLGIGGGMRYIINDRKPNSEKDYAHSINLDRNTGIKDLDI
jgi:hydroxymethylpyrimidine pyrophosphatase-like HAD family hydrolase